MQRDQTKGSQMVSAPEHCVCTPCQMMSEYWQCAKHNQHGDGEHDRSTMRLLAPNDPAGEEPRGGCRLALSVRHRLLRTGIASCIAEPASDQTSKFRQLLGVSLSEDVHERGGHRFRAKGEYSLHYTARCLRAKLALAERRGEMQEVIAFVATKQSLRHQLIQHRDDRERGNSMRSHNPIVHGARGHRAPDRPHCAHDARFEIAEDLGEAVRR